jgi:hypothetical protein
MLALAPRSEAVSKPSRSGVEQLQELYLALPVLVETAKSDGGDPEAIEGSFNLRSERFWCRPSLSAIGYLATLNFNRLASQKR